MQSAGKHRPFNHTRWPVGSPSSSRSHRRVRAGHKRVAPRDFWPDGGTLLLCRLPSGRPSDNAAHHPEEQRVENRDGSLNLRFDFLPTDPTTTIQLRNFDERD